MWRSLELGDLVDASEYWMPVLHFETLALERVLLHALVVECANGVQVGALGELLELLGRLVQLEHLFDAVVVLAHVVLVLVDAESTVDLILEAEHFIITFVFITYKLIN